MYSWTNLCSTTIILTTKLTYDDMRLFFSSALLSEQKKSTNKQTNNNQIAQSLQYKSHSLLEIIGKYLFFIIPELKRSTGFVLCMILWIRFVTSFRLQELRRMDPDTAFGRNRKLIFL